jgi:hypothetical protein
VLGIVRDERQPQRQGMCGNQGVERADQAASTTTAANSAKNLIPGYADRSLAFQIVEAPVEFCTLRSGKRNRLGRRPNTVPQLLQQVEPLFGCQRCDI